jgi:hypothetical protein
MHRYLFPQFRKIIGILEHFYATVGLPDVRLPDVRLSDVRLSDVRLPDVRLPDVLRDERNVESKIKSIRKFILQLQDFVAYQDILAPYISGLIQVGSL